MIDLLVPSEPMRIVYTYRSTRSNMMLIKFNQYLTSLK